MNGPVQMYRTKQIIKHDVPVELPKCMYKMRSVHSSANGGVVIADQQQQVAPKLDIISEQVKQFLKVSLFSLYT